MANGADPMDACGCCAGVTVLTPGRVENRPGLPAVAYRVGRHADFRASMLARLSGAALPSLRPLRTRDGDDFTVALLDSAAAMLDVLTFYQERLANESWLRTARDRRSVRELAALIGYRPAPGVAAATHLAFTLQESPGDPTQTPAPVVIPVGTRVQSVPGPDEAPQTFETVAEAEARPAWNAIPAQTTEPWLPAIGERELWLAGTATQLQPGDVILLVGAERAGDVNSGLWEGRVLRTVEPDPDHGRTRVTWAEALDSPPAQDVRVHAMRQRAALFGHNAPDPRLMSTRGTELGDMTEVVATVRVWKDFAVGTVIDLDAAYPKVVPGGWVILVSNVSVADSDPLAGWALLYRASMVSHPSRTGFGLSAKITRVHPDTTAWLSSFGLRTASVLAQSEELATAPRPLLSPVFGADLPLARRVDGLRPGQALAVSGLRQRVRLRETATGLSLAVDGGGSVALQPRDELWMTAPPVRVDGATLTPVTPAQLAQHLVPGAAAVTLRLRLRDRGMREGVLNASSAQLRLAPARKEDEPVAEVAWVDEAQDAVTHSRDRTTLRLDAGLRHCYDRDSLRVNGNVAPATHGETVAEPLGSGDAAARDQRFTLKQGPLTYVASPATPDGRASTLEVRVNDLRWREAPTLYARGPAERAYATATDEEGRAVVRFGDGAEGARLPSGQDNVRARYRKGAGTAGNLGAGRLTTLLTRPLGVTGAINPEPATGGADAEALDDARANAPLQVLTLGRAVSVRDYEDFARAFAGIARAHAVWIPHGPARGVFVTVAGPGGAAVPSPGPTHAALVGALRRFGDALLPLRVVSYAPAPFRVRARVKVADDAEPEPVLEAARALLRERFGFAARAFGQTVSVDEVAAVLHEVAGVVAVDVDALNRGAGPDLQPRLFASVPYASPAGAPAPAELLTLDEAFLELGVMP